MWCVVCRGVVRLRHALCGLWVLSSVKSTASVSRPRTPPSAASITPPTTPGPSHTHTRRPSASGIAAAAVAACKSPKHQSALIKAPSSGSGSKNSGGSPQPLVRFYHNASAKGSLLDPVWSLVVKTNRQRSVPFAFPQASIPVVSTAVGSSSVQSAGVAFASSVGASAVAVADGAALPAAVVLLFECHDRLGEKWPEMLIALQSISRMVLQRLPSPELLDSLCVCVVASGVPRTDDHLFLAPSARRLQSSGQCPAHRTRRPSLTLLCDLTCTA